MKYPAMARRLLSLFLAVAICFSLVPWKVFAAETGTYTQVTSAEDFTSGQYVLVTDTGYAPSVLEGGWILAVQPAIENGVVTDPAGAVWTLTVDGSSVKLTDPNGTSVAPKGGNSNGIKSGDYNWAWSFENGGLTFAGTGADTVILASNKSSGNQFRAYKTVTIAGNPAGYPCTFTAYKLVEETAEPKPSEPGQPSEPVLVISTIAEAKAMASDTENITVEATVIRLDGKNVVVQDATGGINLYFSEAPSGIALGDVIRATGKRSTYNGLEQLTGVSAYEKTGTAELPVKEVTIADILADQDKGELESTRVLIKSAILGEIVTSSNTTLTQGEASINIYRIPALEGIAAGDTVDVYAIISDYKGYQLRVNAAADVTKVASAEPEQPSKPEEPEEPTGVTWTKAELADIADTDTIAITMTGKDGTTWVLPVTAEGGKGQPLATYTGTIDGDTLTTDSAEAYSWNFVTAEDGYYIKTGENYLYVIANNNGVRIGNTAAVWNIAEGYLAAADSKDTMRYLGVYNGTDWRCYTNTTGNTAGQTLGLWKLNVEEPEVPEVTGIVDGTYVIWAPAYNMALSSTYNGFYNTGVAVTMEGEKLSGYGNSEIWTVKNNEDGTVTISCADGKLSMDTSFSSMPLNKVNDTWTLEAAGDDLWYVKNVGRDSYIEWYEKNSNWSGYYKIAEGSEGCFALKFTPAEKVEEEPEEPEIPTGVADGDYVIWAPAYNMALSSTYNGFYNTGVAVTMEGEKLSGYGNSEIWTVKNNEDGTVTISCADGKLSMDTSFSSMPLNKVNETWTLEAAGDDLWYVKNVGRGSYIEWYEQNNNWSGYYKIAEGSEGMFALRFTPAEKVEEEPEEPTGVADGDYVIWAPAYNKALSSVYGGFYNNGVDVTLSGETLTGYENTEIWTVTNQEDGTITISYGGQNLAMADTYASLTLGEKHAAWTLEAAGDGLWYVKNVGRESYIEWYAEKKYWSGYYNIAAGSEGMFALCFTPAQRSTATDSSVVEDIAQWGGMTNANNTAFIYGDKYVSGDEADIEDIFTAVVSGAAVTPWTKGGNNDAPLYYMGGAGLGSGSDDYLQFAVNAAGWGDMELAFRLRASNSGPGSFQLKYSADNGETWQNFTTGTYAYAYTAYNGDESYPVTGEGSVSDGIARTSYAPGKYVSFVFDVPTGADNCRQLLIRLVPGTDKANGKTGAISTTGTVRIDSVVLSGSPVVDESVTGFVTVTPDGSVDQPIGTELTMTSATEGATIYYRVSGGEWTVYDESSKPVLNTLPCTVEAYASAEGKADSVVLLYSYAAGTVKAVKFTPNGGGIYIEGESAQITLSTATEGAVIYYATSADGVTFTEFAEYSEAIVVNKGFGKLVIQAYAQKEGYTESALVTRTFTERSSSSYQIFFGQLHSHTNISDGSGSVEEAFEHASNVKGLDFLAVTDHSNSFDGESNGVLSQDGSLVSDEWKQGHEAAAAVTDEDFVGLYGFEMTWSNGLGHINTFNTPGWQSRTQADFKTQSTALQNYYAALATVPESISQFNHPGTTFGDFSDFAHYSEGTDALITLIEVGNGEGAIGSGGYFPSYEYYTRALDKGWHVAPTNNQDNHKGLWGDANTGRSVILADSLTEADIYDALRNYRVYATEDNDLEIYYTLNGLIMGSMLETADVEENLTISVSISDATDSAVGKVEVIVNGGLTAASQSLNAASGTVELTVPADYNYYYIKITQPDGDIAVTAPVWVGKVEAVGISSLEAESALTIAGEAQTFTAELFNNERSDLLVESLIYTNKATGEVLFTETAIASVAKESTATSSFSHTFAADGVYTITATLKGTLNGVSKTYTKDLEITVMPRSITSRIIVDGSHSNDYVTGYYGGNLNNMVTIAAAQGIQVHVETNAITPEMLENCSLLIVSAPAKKLDRNNPDAYAVKPFEDAFIEMVAEYVKNGGSVVVCGLADYQDKGAVHGAEGHTAAQLNKLLAAMGSTMKINDDEAYDDINFSNQNYRLYPKNFNMESPWCAGIITGDEGQVYSQYSGCTVDPGQGTWLVKGFDTTYSIDSDSDGLGGVNKGEAVFMAAEATPYGGDIFVAGGVFLSDFEVQAELDNIWSLPYANRTIYENIIGITRTQPEVTPIADVRASAENALGHIFVVEGYVTAGTDNEHTTFFDAIYVQDETGGITVFPYSQAGLALGTKVRITGYTDAYQGDIEIQIMSLEILDEPKNVITPEKVSNADAMDYAKNGGELLQVEGEVMEVSLTSDGMGVAQFVVKDENGDLAKVFIDGYILSGTTGENTLADIVKVGNTVSAVGLLYMHPEGDSEESIAVLRVRNCDEVVLISEKEEEPEEPETDKTKLKQAIDMAKAKKKSLYTPKSWDAMQEALRAAEAVYANEDATQKEIDDAAETLNKAIEALVKSNVNSPVTGDDTMIGLCITTMTLSLLAAALLIWSRKRFAL